MTSFFVRYGRASILTPKLQPHSKSLEKLSYLWKKSKSEMKEVTNATTTSETDASSTDEPIDEIGGPLYLPSIEIIIRKIHHEIKDVPSLPPISSAFNVLKGKFFENRIEACNLMCDFTDPEADLNAKKTKTQALKEIINLTKTKDDIIKIDSTMIDAMFQMIEKNLFRGLPLIPKKYLVYDEELLFSEIIWPHLSLVYTILLQYQAAFPTDPHFTRDFVTKLINNCSSCDINEREQVLQFLINHTTANPGDMHMVMMKLSNMCRNYIDGSANSFCVTPALKYFINIIQIPTFQEFDYFSKIFGVSILPLLTCLHLATFVPFLDQLFDFMTTKDQTYATLILDFILRHWPISFPSKQLIYLHYITFILQKLTLKKFSVVAPRVFTFYAQCLTSKCHKVAEASLKVWGNVKIIPLILDNTRVIFPIIIDPLIRMMKYHWNPNTRAAALSAYKQIHDIDPFVFDEISNKLGKKPKENVESETLKSWAQVARVSAKNDRDINLAKLLAEMQVTFIAINELKRDGLTKPKRPK